MQDKSVKKKTQSCRFRHLRHLIQYLSHQLLYLQHLLRLLRRPESSTKLPRHQQRRNLRQWRRPIQMRIQKGRSTTLLEILIIKALQWMGQRMMKMIPWNHLSIRQRQRNQHQPRMLREANQHQPRMFQESFRVSRTTSLPSGFKHYIIEGTANGNFCSVNVWLKVFKHMFKGF